MPPRAQTPPTGASGFARVLAPTLADERPPLRRAPHAALLALLCAAWFGGLFERAELALLDLRFGASSRPASGALVLVEAGPARAAPAELAAALDRLLAAGVRQVAFAGPAPFGDAALQAALARAGGRAIAPAAAAAAEWTGRLAAPDLPPDADGRVRAVPIWSEHDGEMIPGIPAALLGVDVAGAPAAPLVDFSIDPATLPRLALADVLAAGDDLRALAGADAILAVRRPGAPLAATARGPLPTADLLALSYETLAQQRWILRAGALATLAPAAAFMLAFGPWFARMGRRRGLALVCAWQAACLVLAVVAQARWAIGLNVLPWLAASLLSYAWEAVARFRPPVFAPRAAGDRGWLAEP